MHFGIIKAHRWRRKPFTSQDANVDPSTNAENRSFPNASGITKLTGIKTTG